MASGTRNSAEASSDRPQASSSESILRQLGIQLDCDFTPPKDAEIVFADRSQFSGGLSIEKTEQGHFVLTYAARHIVQIDPSGNSIMLAPGEEPDSPAYRHILLDDAAPRLLSHQRRWCFHMGGVRFGQNSIAVAGPSGAGKSSLSAALVRHGAKLQSDDCISIDMSQNAPLSSPLYPGLRLWSDSLEALKDLGREGVSEAAPAGKTGLHLNPDRVSVEPSSLSAIYILHRHSEHSAVSAEQLSPSGSTFAVAQNVFGLDLSDVSWRGDLLNVAAAISSVTPVYTLNVPDGLDLLNSTAAFLTKRHS